MLQHQLKLDPGLRDRGQPNLSHSLRVAAGPDQVDVPGKIALRFLDGQRSLQPVAGQGKPAVFIGVDRPPYFLIAGGGALGQGHPGPLQRLARFALNRSGNDGGLHGGQGAGQVRVPFLDLHRHPVGLLVGKGKALRQRHLIGHPADRFIRQNAAAAAQPLACIRVIPVDGIPLGDRGPVRPGHGQGKAVAIHNIFISTIIFFRIGLGIGARLHIQRKAGAPVERAVHRSPRDGGHAGGDHHLPQAFTGPKGPVLDGGNAAGQDNRLDFFAIIQRTRLDHFQRGGHVDVFQYVTLSKEALGKDGQMVGQPGCHHIFAPFECISAKAGDAVRHHDLGNHLASFKGVGPDGGDALGDGQRLHLSTASERRVSNGFDVGWYGNGGNFGIGQHRI